MTAAAFEDLAVSRKDSLELPGQYAFDAGAGSLAVTDREPEGGFCHRQSNSLLSGDFLWNVTPSLPVLPRLWAGWRTGVRPTPLRNVLDSARRATAPSAIGSC